MLLVVFDGSELVLSARGGGPKLQGVKMICKMVMILSCLPSSRSTLQKLHIATWYTCTTYCCMHYTPCTLSMGYSYTELNEKPENSLSIVTQICMNSTGSGAGGTGPGPAEPVRGRRNRSDRFGHGQTKFSASDLFCCRFWSTIVKHVVYTIPTRTRELRCGRAMERSRTFQKSS